MLMLAGARGARPARAQARAGAERARGRRAGVCAGARVARRRAVRVCAEQERSTQTKDVDEEEFLAGFKYDGALQRWMKDDKVNYYSTKAKTLDGEYTVWPAIYLYLEQKGLTSLPGEEVEETMRKGGCVLLDTRIPDDFEMEHIEGAVNAPLFRVIPSDSDRWFDKLKRVAMAGIAMKATERNPDFVAQAEQAIGDKNKPVVVYCTMGGTMDTRVGYKSKNYKDKGFADKDRAFGRESRSLKACYELMKAGFKNVYHLDKGMSQWRYRGGPMAGVKWEE
ncbi:unnamed protein product [Pedinophyceae sp. YPF-701]|nr:unnamed protein product [Pedinophyceae sp. YPF-701]